MDDRVYFHKIIKPHQSLSIAGQKLALYILLAFLLVLAPPLMAMGAWVALLFLFSPVGFMVAALHRNNYDHRLCEEMTITRAELYLRRIDPNGRLREFRSDPYFVKIELRDDGPVEKYLTLRNQSRNVEFGAFLSPDERQALYREIKIALADTKCR